MASGSNASGFAARYLSMSGSTLVDAGARPVSQPPVPARQSFADDGNNVCLCTVEVECLLTYCENLMSALFKLIHDLVRARPSNRPNRVASPERPVDGVTGGPPSKPLARYGAICGALARGLLGGPGGRPSN